MSNYLAIATVTYAIRQILDAAAKEAIAVATVKVGRSQTPAQGRQEPSINLYLYQSVPNPAWRNTERQTRRESGGRKQMPQVALDLHYLITFYGDEGRLEPERLLGKAVSVLASQPVISRAMIEALRQTDSNHFLAESDLAEQVEEIRITPLALSLAEMVDIWQGLLQVPYTLSVAYAASVVLIG